MRGGAGLWRMHNMGVGGVMVRMLLECLEIGDVDFGRDRQCDTVSGFCTGDLVCGGYRNEWRGGNWEKHEGDALEKWVNCCQRLVHSHLPFTL